MRVPEDMPPRRRRRGRLVQRARSGRGRVLLVVAAVVLFILITSLRGIASFYTDYLWFSSLDQSSVFRAVLGAKAALVMIFTGLFFVLLWVNLWIADRIAPRFRPAGPEEELVERYHELVGGRTAQVRVGVALVFALIAGAGVSSQWNEWLLFINRVDFGEVDPLFKRDIGFFVFQLPFLSFVVDWLFAAFVIVLIVTAVEHYLNGGIRVNTPFQRVTPQVKGHISVLLALLALIKAGDYYLRQFELTASHRGTVDGALYTDVNVQLPAIRLLLLISLFAFVLFIVNIRRRGWVLPVLAVGLWALVSVVAGGIVPAIIQRFRVEPDELTKESRYIERNIEATRAALGLADVDSVQFAEGAVGTISDDDLVANAETINNIRLWDPSSQVLGSTFRRLQELRSFYEIADVDVDRYEIDGQLRQVMVATRELNSGGVRQTSWAARHLSFTHGYGVVLAPAYLRDPEGQPAFLISGVPIRNDSGIDLEQPGLYIGEGQGGYVVVNSARDEVDFQNEQGDSVETRYDGADGVGIGSWLRRAAFALRFGDFNPLFSGGITGDSRILYIRDVRERVEALAPFLSFDDDPYPVIIDGRIVWVLDAYTTTSRYPYGQEADVSGLPEGSGLRHSFNYARNSVKAVVDAYTGEVNLYIIDDRDPIAEAYRRAFPALFADEAIDEELEGHFRYPQDLFFVQTNMWGRYHQTSADSFFNNADTWVVARAPGAETVTPTTLAGGGTSPQQPTAGSTRRADPLYVLLDLPGGDPGLEFVLMRPFVPAPRQGTEPQQLTAFMVAGSDPDKYGDIQVFEMDTPLPDGPGIVANRMSSNPDVAELQTLLGISGGGSELIFGNLLAVPIGDALLYVRPVYVQAEGEDGLPLLRKVIVEHRTEVAVADTLREALGLIFGEIPEEVEGDVVRDGDTTPETPDTEEPEEPTEQTIAELLAEAQSLFEEAQAALQQGNLGEYQRLIDEAVERVAEAAQLAAEAGGVEPTTTTTTGAGSGGTTSTTTA